ncbi:hypothetical protein ABT061_06780 [Streptosporangium sp. NPDC002544]|uniref:hypothetical protein n=1 Tax=Streptosporangium sp. NPDC002544 TaxID=3154538 RepID=UPI00331F4F5D
MEGLKLQQPTVVGLGAAVLFGLDSGWADWGGGANTQRGVFDDDDPWFETGRASGDSAVRLRQGARLQHEAMSAGSHTSEAERLNEGGGTTVRGEESTAWGWLSRTHSLSRVGS